MLGKLIKNEFKAVNRLMIPLHLGLIVITIIGRFYLQLTVFNNPGRTYYMMLEQNIWYNLLNVMLVMFYVIALIAAALITWIYLSILRFRKNLFTDEGYLMHTLPVSASAHIWSKLIVNFVWQVIDILLIILSIFGLFLNMDMIRALPEGFSLLFSSFPEAFGVPAGVGIPLYLLLFLIESVSGILIIYMCIAIGHSFNSHKILASVGIYVGVWIIANILSSVCAAITGMVSYGSSSLLIGVANNLPNATYFWLSWIMSLLLCLICGVAGYLLSNYFMTKRLNLE